VTGAGRGIGKGIALELARATPLGPLGYPLDVARAVVFLAGPQASFISGQTIWVDGGLFCQPPWVQQHAR
jgi:NAD(P)-dependent dehydrogenase (short-subunit alcohol dehydrogenase family)